MQEKNIYVIEDCSQAHGAKLNNKFVGTYADISVWSFCQDKIISTLGEGGIVATDNEKLYYRLLSYRDHGKNFNNLSKIKNLNQFSYINDYIGTNIRMTEIQAAVGFVQLDYLNNWIEKRNDIIKYLEKRLCKIKKEYYLSKILKILNTLIIDIIFSSELKNLKKIGTI